VHPLRKLHTVADDVTGPIQSFLRHSGFTCGATFVRQLLSTAYHKSSEGLHLPSVDVFSIIKGFYCPCSALWSKSRSLEPSRVLAFCRTSEPGGRSVGSITPMYSSLGVFDWFANEALLTALSNFPSSPAWGNGRSNEQITVWLSQTRMGLTRIKYR